MKSGPAKIVSDAVIGFGNDRRHLLDAAIDVLVALAAATPAVTARRRMKVVAGDWRKAQAL
jgi:hypothetical protein